MSHECYGRGHCQHLNKEGKKHCAEPVALTGTGGEAEAWFMGGLDRKKPGFTMIKPLTTDKSELCYYHRKQKRLAKHKINY